MSRYPEIGDVYKWPTKPEKFFLVVDFPKFYIGDPAIVCLELGTEDCYSQIRASDLCKLAEKVG